MDFLTNIWNYITNSIKAVMSDNQKPVINNKKVNKGSVFGAPKKKVYKNEISMIGSKSDEQLRIEAVRSNYIVSVKNPYYRLKSGDTVADIAKKYSVEECSILDANSLDKNSAKKIVAGKVLKIPPRRKVKNVRNLSDVSKAMGVSYDFIKKLKRAEDSSKLGDFKFHNTPYIDDAGVKTIGIGHVLKKGEPQKLSNAQVCELLAKDLLKVEENLYSIMGGKKNYDKLPQPIKEALLDMSFNKGADVITKIPGLVYALKAGKYEAAINKMTYCKSNKTGDEMSGLCKRRIFDISLASKIYKGRIPQSNINTAQKLYNRGVQLLRAECKTSGNNFKNILVGYNNEVKSYMGNKIKLVTK